MGKHQKMGLNPGNGEEWLWNNRTIGDIMDNINSLLTEIYQEDYVRVKCVVFKDGLAVWRVYVNDYDYEVIGTNPIPWLRTNGIRLNYRGQFVIKSVPSETAV